MTATLSKLIPGAFTAMQKRLVAAGMLSHIDGEYHLTDAGNAWTIACQDALSQGKVPPAMPKAAPVPTSAAA